MAKTRNTLLPDGNYRRGPLITRKERDGTLTWYVKTTITVAKGVSHRVRKTTGCAFADHLLAEARCATILNEVRQSLIANGEFAAKPTLTWSAFIPIFRRTYEHERPTGGHATLSPLTVEHHTQMLIPLTAFFGNTMLSKITEADCLTYRARRLAASPVDRYGHPRPGKLSPNTVLVECQFASRIMTCAVRYGQAQRNPWADIPLGTMTSRERHLSPDEQVKAFNVACAEDRRLMTVIIGTTFRVGAITAMKDTDLIIEQVRNPFTSEIISVPMVLVMSKRKLHRQPLIPVVQRAIEDQIAYLKGGATENRYRIGRRAPRWDGRVFPYSRNNIEARLARIAVAANIPHFSPHDLRRTFATRANVTLGDNATAQLLNNSPDVTRKFYDKGDKDYAKYAGLLSVEGLLALPEPRKID